MNLILKTLLLSTIFQLVLSPIKMDFVSPQAWASNPQDDCDAMPGYHWQGGEDGRCVLDDDINEFKAQAGQCEQLEGEAKAECFKENATNQENAVTTGNGIDNTSGINAGNIARFGLPLVAGFVGANALIKKSTTGSCSIASFWLLVAGAVTTLTTEVLVQINYSKDIKKIRENYKKRLVGEEGESLQNTTDGQTLALELMIEQEKKRKKAAKGRKLGYTAATVMYGAAAILGVYEAIYNSSSTCTSAQSKDILPGELEDSIVPANRIAFLSDQLPGALLYKELTLQDIISITANKIKGLIIPNSAYAFGPSIFFTSLAAAEGTPFGQTIKNMVKQGTTTPATVAVIGGVMGGYSGYMLSRAAKQVRIADERIEAITGILNTYNTSGGQGWSDCTPEQRDNAGVPACYCYNNDGTVNASRKNRPTCHAYNSNKTMTAGLYGGLSSDGYTPVKACILSSGQVDEGCKVCGKSPKKCPVIASANVGSLKLGNQLGVPEMIEQSNKLATGQLSPSDLNAGSLDKKIARLDSAKKQLAKNKDLKKTFDKVDKQVQAFNKAAAKAFDKTMASDKGAMLAALGSFSPDQVRKEESVDEEAKRLVSKATTIKKSLTNSKKKPKDFEFNFGDEGGGIEVAGDTGAVEPEYEITGDIHKNKDQNLFNILSLRYQRSGFRRLFDENGRSKADSPNENTINAQ